MKLYVDTGKQSAVSEDAEPECGPDGSEFRAPSGRDHKAKAVDRVGRAMATTRRALPGHAPLLAVALLIVCTSGCAAQPPNEDGAASPAALNTRSPAAVSSDSAATGRAALDAYRGMWQAYQDALQVPDPASGELARYATGDALDILIKGLRSVKDQGLKGTGTVSLAPEITSVFPAAAPTEIDVTDCLDSSNSRLVRVSAGPAYDDPPGGHRRVLATVRRQPDGSWKVSNFGAQAVGTC